MILKSRIVHKYTANILKLHVRLMNRKKTKSHPGWEVQYPTRLFLLIPPLQLISHSDAVNWSLKKAAHFLLQSKPLQWILQWALSRWAFVKGTQSVYYVVSEWRCGRLIYVSNCHEFQSPLSRFSYFTRKTGGGTSINAVAPLPSPIMFEHV